MTHSSDLIVVGAGVIGCAVAAECARRGARVTLIDARGVGRGATQASAGLLAPFVEAPRDSPLRALGARSLALYDDFVERTADESGCSIEYARCGTLQIATSQAAFATLQATAARHAADGIACELLDREALGRREPDLADAVVGGLFVPTHGFVAAAELTAALARAAKRRAATVVEEGAVHRIAADGRGLRVDVDEAAHRAPTVVLAAGAWSATIAVEGSVPIPVRPVRGQLVVLGRRGVSPSCPLWGPACYLVPRRDGRLLVGATVEEAGFDERATVAGIVDLLEAACALVPRCREATFLEARVGFRPATPDEVPIIGPSRRLPGLIYATGHYRNGVLLAPITAELVATLALEGRSDPLLEPCSPARFGEL